MYQESGQTGWNAGIIWSSNLGKKIQKRKGSHCRNNSQRKKGAEGAVDGMQPIGMPPKQKKKKAVSANQMDKQWWKAIFLELCFNKRSRKNNWQMAWMFVTPHSSSSATKSKKLQATKLRRGLPNVQNKNQSFPVLLGIHHVPRACCCQNAAARESATWTWRVSQYCCHHKVQEQLGAS